MSHGEEQLETGAPAPRRLRSKTAEIIRQNYEAVKRLLAQDPLLTYQAESDQVYQVSNGADFFLQVSKNRQAPEPYPAPDPLRPAFRWLGWACLGLAPAGLGTLIFAPLAAASAWRLYRRHSLSPADRSRALIVLGIAAALLSLGLSLNMLFIFRWS